MGKEYSVHQMGCCESTSVGKNTRIWAYTHVLPGAVIGAECNICDQVFIENDVKIGDRVTIKCGVQVWDGVELEDDVFVGPNATFTNDPFPRSKAHPGEFNKTTVQAGASIGANATILSGLTIGRKAMIGAGAVVTKSVPANAIVVGNPASIIGYVGTPKAERRIDNQKQHNAAEDYAVNVKGVSLLTLPKFQDMRGSLSAGEMETHIPFRVKRYFIVYDVVSKEVRGEHAHKECHQFMVCVKGSVSCVVDDGKNRQEILLDRPELGLHIPPMVWGIQYKYSPDATLMVLASEAYNAGDYIRDYQKFIEFQQL